jgi:hypothetical protein
MESAITQFTYLPETKAERETFVQMCVDEIKSGERDPLELEIMLKNMEETINAIRKHPEVKELVMDEALKYPEKTFEFKGVTVTKSSRSTYSYDECNDSILFDLKAKEKELKQGIKDRENFLKGIKPGMEIADVRTGEMLIPPKQTTSDFLTIKLK